MRRNPIRAWIGTALTAFALSLFVVQPAAAQNVAVLGSPGGGATWNADVQTKLLASGFFSGVDVIDVSATTPSLATLLMYESVLVYSDSPGYADAAGLGNVLADYVDGGGGVVDAVFSNASIAFSGRFATDNYWVIQPASQTQGTQLTLGNVLDPSSPIMAGVTSFDGGSSSYRSTGGLHPLASVVAEWSNGAPLVATREIGLARRVALNFYPPSSDVRADFWTSSTDGGLLMANALSYAGRTASVPEPTTALLMLGGLFGLIGISRTRRVAIE